jgi:hypothetical protein
MANKLKITEQQLKMITERRHTYKSDVEEVEEQETISVVPGEPNEEEEVAVEENVELNESILKIKSEFNRFL